MRGFSVSNEGKALNNASDGQIARAHGQRPDGRGVARPGGIIEITRERLPANGESCRQATMPLKFGAAVPLLLLKTYARMRS